MDAPSPEPDPGPYTSTETKTFRISGPIEFTITTKFDSSHVPPPPAERVDGATPNFMEALRPFIQLILSKLEEIRAAQNPQ